MNAPETISRLVAALSGRYSIERELGEGGMATVFLARDVKHNRHVALKVLKPQLAAVVGADRFLAEIETTAKLQHPHILPLFDSGEADGLLFYVMPYLGSESLRERLDREHQLPVGDAIAIATNVAEALDYAHRQGVIHRDIKPANILLQDGKPVVADFGIALAVSAGGGRRLTEAGLSIGTPQYMSPEQAAGDTNVGPGADIYALACVLFEMLVGAPPHEGSTAQAILARKLTEPVRDVADLRSTVPSHVAAAARVALSPVPADRFGSAGDLARALAGYTTPGVMKPAPVEPRSRRWPVGVAGWVVAIVALVTAFMVGSSRPEAPPVRLALPLGDAEPVLRLISPVMAVSPDGRHIAYVASDSVGRRVFLKRMDGATVALPGSLGGSTPFFSPDSRSVGFFADGQLRTLEIGSDESIALAPIVSDVVGAAWLDDGRIAFTDGYRGGLTVVSRGGGPGGPLSTDPEEMGQLNRRYQVNVSGSPILIYLAMGARGGEDGIYAVDLETDEHHFLIQGTSPQYADGVLFFSRGSGGAHSVHGVALDATRTRVVGDPVALLDGVLF